MVAILDLLTVIILALTIILAAKRGFIKTLIGFLGTIFSFIVAIFFSKNMAVFLNEKYVGPFFEKIVTSSLESFMTTAASDSEVFTEQFNTLLDNAPDALQKLFDKFSVTMGDVTGAFTASADLESAKEAALRAIYEPISAVVSLALGFIIVFLGTLLIIKIAAFVIDSVASLPILKQVNSFFGVLLGALQGIIFVFILTALVSFMAPSIGNYSGKEFNLDTINSTLVFKHFYNISPLKNLLQ